MRRPGAALRFSARALGITQVAALAGLLLRNLADSLGELLVGAFLPQVRREARQTRRRGRSVHRLARTLGILKGPFAKAGQFAALRYDVLDPELREALSGLWDRVPPVPFSSLQGFMEAELGAPLEALFARVDEIPVAAGSIAQAHRAQLPSGEEVLIKIQYPWLAQSLPADLAIAGAAVRLFSLGRPGKHGRTVDPRQLFAEFAKGIAEELDFEREASVAEEVAENLAEDPQIVVPRMVPERSSRRVLTMSYHDGVSVTDRDGLRRLGVAPSEVLEILARSYAKQIFVDGLFHADPHPGNLFVLAESGARNKPRVLFVDFGLCKRLSPELRREMRTGIFALLQNRSEDFLAAMDRMGMIAPGARPGVEQSVCQMMERLREGTGSPLGLQGAEVLSLKDEAKRLLEETEGLQLPNDLLLYAKTLSYLFGLGAELAPEVDLMKISVPYLLRFLSEKE